MKLAPEHSEQDLKRGLWCLVQLEKTLWERSFHINPGLFAQDLGVARDWWFEATVRWISIPNLEDHRSLIVSRYECNVFWNASRPPSTFILTCLETIQICENYRVDFLHWIMKRQASWSDLPMTAPWLFAKTDEKRNLMKSCWYWPDHHQKNTTSRWIMSHLQ